MTLPDSTHPIWRILNVVVVGTILILLLQFNYNGLDKRDILTVITTLAASGGMSWLQASVGKVDV